MLGGVSDIAGGVLGTAADCVGGVVDAISSAFSGAESNASNMANEFNQNNMQKDWTNNPNPNQSK